MERAGNPDTAAPIVDKPARARGGARLLLLGLGLAVTAAALFIIGQGKFGEKIVLAALGALAGLGVFFLFAMVLGLARLASQGKSDAFAKLLVDGTEAGLLVTDSEGRIVYANRAYGDLTGATGEPDVASIETLFSRRMEVSEIIYRMANAAKAGETVVEEFRLASPLRPSDTGGKWFRLRIRPMQHADYRKPLLVWQISDITADRQREEDAFQELQNAINYLDHAPAGFIASEADGSVVYLNATLSDWLGFDLATFQSGTLKLDDIVLGEGVTLLTSVRPDERGTKTAVIDLDLAKSDGRPLPARVYHRVPAMPDGAPGISRTIVVNRLLGEEGDNPQRNAELRFTRFFNNAPVAIASVAEDGSLRRVNAPFQRMFAKIIERRGGVDRLNLRDLAADVDRTSLDAAWSAAVSGNAQIPPVEVPIEGEKNRHVRFYVSPISGDGGADENNDERVTLYALDMSEQRALEMQFAQGQKMQAVGQLAGGVAHDFNNLLTAIIGFSDLLLANHRPSDPSFQDIMNIKQNANRAASLVRQLLAFSRRQTLRPQVIQLGDVLSDLRMLLARLLGENVELQVVHGRDIWPVKVDLSQFEQVVVNLAVNARDAMPEGGRLYIRTSNVDAAMVAKRYSQREMPAADYVLLEVEDEGTGMSADVMEKIFEPFFSTKEVGKGTGLGLSTVYGIVKQTGGYIYVASEPGRGTTFSVFLPRHVATASEVQAAAEQMSPDAEKEKPRDLTGNAVVLLVEDEDAVRAFASRALMSRGYKVHEASSGAEAIEVYAELGSQIDLVVSDVVMPEMDGPTLFRELRKQRPELKFIFMSGYAEDAFARNLPESERQGFGFLPKPFSLKQLATAVKDALEA
jgi:two-component system, cell cycle sensor histidine kinase and response regulator CckA